MWRLSFFLAGSASSPLGVGFSGDPTVTTCALPPPVCDVPCDSPVPAVVLLLAGGGSGAPRMGDSLSKDGPPLVDALSESVVAQPTATGAKVLPQTSFAGKRSFARVARSATQPSKGIHPLPYAKSSLVVVCGQDVVDNIGFYQRCALVCRFFGLWPSLPDLHRWVSDSWRSFVAHNVELFPCAKGFFIASFTSSIDSDLVLGKLWAWGVHPLSIKPWTTSFNPLIEPLNVRLVWVCLPNLPLHFWEISCYETIGNSLS